jgi:2,4-dienoyl-CoA reductase-like NADH-dependent reductase (Old Yellow Enzyme family)
MSALFTPFQLGSVHLPNRIVVSPMCQYSAADGSATDWHRHHLPALGLGGAGLVMTEATHIERRGRITHGCLGLYSDDNEAALSEVLTAARRVAVGGTRFGIQLAHSGRKGSVTQPWDGGTPLLEDQDPWGTVAPSASAFKDSWPVPRALDEDGIERTITAFVRAAERAARIGFDVVELHAGHGYLLHQFLSPLANHRADQWGGSSANRARLLLEITRRVRAILPATIALGIRLTMTDWADGGIDTADAVEVARQMKALGAAYICATGGFVVPPAGIPFGPGYQVHLAERVRREAQIPTRAVGGIADPHQAEAIIAEGKADMVALATAFLADPRWVWRAADTLGVNIPYPPPYARAQRARRPAAPKEQTT